MKKIEPSQLLACPFCGGSADVGETIERIGLNRHRLIIKCSVCPANIDVTFSGASHSTLVRMHRKNDG
ncbi:MAG: Lar family restriction alleviation protein [Methylomonas sp.]|jgi:hypothetical protein|uniref:hypothetical protein n=1 Tax=Methylomonas sp. TaxID=418 RepID=UPI0025EF33BE|nr:hypothetical protein [Methylomonas sp.]MCK9606223.1 Lar family restriction alleviation protein [Methylomonas sp.]